MYWANQSVNAFLNIPSSHVTIILYHLPSPFHHPPTTFPSTSMIQDGYITYGPSRLDFFSWRPSNPFLNQLLTSLIIATLSSQLSHIVTDLFLGFKDLTQARISNIHVAWLMQNPTPSALARALLPRHHATFRGVPDQLGPAHLDQHAKPLVISKLFFLLLILPVINMSVIVLELERTSLLSFRDISFGGIQLGLKSKHQPSVSNWSPHGITCNVAFFKALPHDTSQLRFFLCTTPEAWILGKVPYSDISPVTSNRTFPLIDYVGVSTKITSDDVHISVRYGNLTLLRKVSGIVAGLNVSDMPNIIPRSPHFLMSNSEISQLWSKSKEEQARWCKSINEVDATNSSSSVPYFLVSPKQDTSFEVAGFHFQKCCLNQQTDEYKRSMMSALTDDMVGKITLVNHNNFVSTKQALDDYMFLRRRGMWVGLPVLILALIVTLLIRAFVDRVTRNDVLSIVGVLVRQTLGIPYYDSMLASHDFTVFYNPDIASFESRRCTTNDIHENEQTFRWCTKLVSL